MSVWHLTSDATGLRWLRTDRCTDVVKKKSNWLELPRCYQKLNWNKQLETCWWVAFWQIWLIWNHEAACPCTPLVLFLRTAQTNFLYIYWLNWIILIPWQFHAMDRDLSGLLYLRLTAAVLSAGFTNRHPFGGSPDCFHLAPWHIRYNLAFVTSLNG